MAGYSKKSLVGKLGLKEGARTLLVGAPAGYDKVLGLEGTGYFTVAACPVGYRFHEDKAAKRPKVRFAKEDIIEHRA